MIYKEQLDILKKDLNFQFMNPLAPEIIETIETLWRVVEAIKKIEYYHSEDCSCAELCNCGVTQLDAELFRLR